MASASSKSRFIKKQEGNGLLFGSNSSFKGVPFLGTIF